MNLYERLRQTIFGTHDPYAGFPYREWSGVWYSDKGACQPIFKEAIHLANPGIIVEVGSFVGESAIHMAKCLQEEKLEAVILCVDTWGGGIDHWEKVPEKLRFWFGRPSLFYQFMGNVCDHSVQGYILPIAMDSINGARLLKLKGIVPNMVYVDGSHEAGDVLRDMGTYWNLIPKGGVMLSDDVGPWFPEVENDWYHFVGLMGLKPYKRVDEKALLIK